MNPYESEVFLFILINFLNAYMVSYVHRRRRLLIESKKVEVSRKLASGGDMDALSLEVITYKYTPHFFALLVPLYLAYFTSTSTWMLLLLICLSIGWSFLISWGGLKDSYAEVFKSTETFSRVIPKSVSEIANNAILNYTRVTIHNIQESQIIFDSSDFDIINDKFGTKQGAQPSFFEGGMIQLGDDKYKITKLNVDFLNIFDDYSSVGKTEVNIGAPIPYNIQIVIHVDKWKIQ
jgi:hypothetical protein